MKRYLVFVYDQYYPCGGMHDFKGDFDTYEEASKFISTESGDVKEIYDTETKGIVYR